ncbi:hypothetical protein [Micromonospora sp. NPDC051296]|uniref:hypothetical protein n=1 Tax=Micromonospora sp. NPDC051296 TaxID=3155046 RepID=UPI0034265122
MSHPQPPDGPQDPYRPNPEQQPSDPWAPLPPVGPTPGPAPDGTWAAPQQPEAAGPWAAPQPPGTAQPPMSGEPWAPVSGAPQPPTSGAPYPPGAPYQAAGPYPPSGPHPPSGAYPPGGYGYPPGAQPVAPSGAKSNKTILIVVIVVVVLALLCCVGGIVALIAGANRAAEEASESLPTPAVTRALPEPPSSAPTESGPPAPANVGETFNMRPGDTLVLTDNDGTIEITVAKFRTVTEGCSSFAPKPQKGRYLIADVTSTVTKGTGSINPFYFEWVADDGTTVNGLVGALSGCGDPLGSGNNLRAGSKRAGTVVFDVADTKGVLEYRHLFETAGSWKP